MNRRAIVKPTKRKTARQPGWGQKWIRTQDFATYCKRDLIVSKTCNDLQVNQGPCIFSVVENFLLELGFSNVEVEQKLQHKLQQKTCDSEIFYSKMILFIWSLELSPTIRKLHSGKYPPPLFRLKKTHVSCEKFAPKRNKFCNLLKQGSLYYQPKQCTI